MTNETNPTAQELDGFELVAGYPTPASAQAAFDEFDFQAATQFYVWAYGYLNAMGMERGFAAMGGDERSIYIFDRRMQPQHVVMTANGEVIYVWTRYLDVSEGPVVVEVPPRSRGHFWDFGHRAYEDSGDVGPDRGDGGRYLLMGADFDGEIPSDVFPVRVSHSNLAMWGGRTFPAAEGSVEAAVELARSTRCYRLSEADDPPTNEVVLIGDRPYSQDWPKGAEAFEWLADVFNRDKVPASGLGYLGNMRRLGLEAGKPFSPDDRARAILERAAAAGEAIVLSMAFQNRQGDRIYDDRQYEPYITHRHSDFFTDTYEEVEQRAGAWHQLVGNFASFIPAEPGTGQFSMTTYRDADGNTLDGSNTYRLRIPPDPPVAQFWQIPVYEVKTRSLINTDQRRPTLSSMDDLITNDDGSVDLYFAPEPPDDFEQNWIKTIPNEGWFILARLYAPLEPILNKEWRLDDIELIG